MKYLIGIDVGTTGAKTILIDERGNLIASSLVEYPLHTPRPKWAEQDPADWWRGTVDSIKNVLTQSGVKADDVSGLGQVHEIGLLHRLLGRQGALQLKNHYSQENQASPHQL